MEFVTKEEFNCLSIEKQVYYFNKAMQKSNTVKECCNYIGISYSTLRNRFKMNNYFFNKYSRKYEKNEKLNGSLDVDVENNKNDIALSGFSNLNIDDEVVVRSFRIYNSVLNEFILFCENCNLKQYDILSLFLRDGMDKYRKKQ